MEINEIIQIDPTLFLIWVNSWMKVVWRMITKHWLNIEINGINQIDLILFPF